MIKFICLCNKKIDICQIERMDYIGLLKIECEFRIVIDDKTFYEQPLFPVVEFLKFYFDWRNNIKKDFLYNTIESEENPMVAFLKTKNGWKVYSVWQKFECNNLFDINTLIKAVDRMIATIRTDGDVHFSSHFTK